MKKIAFASDFDNTLFFGKEPSPFRKEDLRAIKAFRSKGGLFGVCTGRAKRGIEYPSCGILRYDFKIRTTGSYILGEKDEILYSDPIDSPLARGVYDYLKASYPFWIVVNIGDALLSEKEGFDGLGRASDEDSLFLHPAYGISIDCLTQEKAFAVKKEIEEKFPFIIAYQNRNFLDRVKKGNSKGVGIRKRKKLLSVDILAGRGDSFNDLPLLEEASPSYTFLSSPSELQKKADKALPHLSDALNDLRERFL